MMPGLGMPSEEPKAAAVKSDIIFIRCQVCEAVVKQAVRRVKGMREELKPGKRVEESAIIDFLENMCNVAKPDGSWISHYDIVEEGDRLKLTDTGKPSKCNSECATIARACSDVTESMDLSDLSEALFSGKSRSSLTQTACYDMTDACTAKPPPVPLDRAPGPPHVPMSADEAEREAMMARMKAAGLGGKMYNRDDIMSQMDDLQGMADSGEFPEVPLREEAARTPSGAVVDAVAKAAEVAQDVAGRAKEVVTQASEYATAAVGKAGSLLQGTLGKLSSSFRGKQEQEL
jgi:hypothetical protein